MKFWHKISIYRIQTDEMEGRTHRWKPLRKGSGGLLGTLDCVAPPVLPAGGAPSTPCPVARPLPGSWLPLSRPDSMNKQLSSAYCLPGPGTDPGYTEMSKAASSFLKSPQSRGRLLSTLRGALYLPGLLIKKCLFLGLPSPPPEMSVER